MPSESVRYLQELTERLPEFPAELPINPGLPGIKMHKMECGTCWSANLYSVPEISVAWFINTNGTVFPEHAHDQREWLIVFAGSMFLRRKARVDDRLKKIDAKMVALNEERVQLQRAHAEGHEWVEMPEERLNVGQSAILDAHEIHGARFLEDCQYMAITVPQCEDWPA